MKVNAINSTMYMTKAPAFSHIAVPYPEYENNSQYNQSSSVEKMINRLSSLFTPEVTEKSQKIKNDINKIYESQNLQNDFNAKQQNHLLFTYA